MKKEKNYKILAIIFGVGIIICFVGFTLSGSFLKNTNEILPWFFGFGACGLLAAIFSSKAQGKNENSKSNIIHNSRVIRRCQCGTLNDEDANYCKKCGRNIINQEIDS